MKTALNSFFSVFFQADSEDGLLLYCGENEHGRGDFTALALVRGKVHYRCGRVLRGFAAAGKQLKASKSC